LQLVETKMCETLQLNWKLPNPLKPMASSTMLANNNNNSSSKRKTQPNQKPKTTSTTGSGRQKKSNEKYGLRACSIQKRIEVEGRKGQPKKRGPKPRPKPQPMSKYRRRTANLRERMRMGEINTAFESLREKIPTPLAANKGRCEKLTKINILHVAINYIRALESILDTGDAGVQVYGTSVVRSPFDCPMSGQYETEVPAQHVFGEKRIGSGGQQRKKQPSSSSSSSFSNSGSEDSGIVDEEMEPDEDDIDEDDDDDDDDDDDEDVGESNIKVECPDWTELTSTLEFPPLSSFPDKSLGRNAAAAGPPIKLSMRTNMDTLLSTAAAQLGSMIPVQFNLGDFDPKPRNVLQPIKINSNVMPPVNRQASFTDIGGPDSSDLLGDLNALEDSLEEGFGGINFVHEDPFQIFI
jgi:hypothetical protein